MTQECARLPYAFALRSGAILSGDGTSGITLLHRDKMSLPTLLECQRLSGRIDAFKQLSASDFELALAETYKSSARRAADLAAESNSDLAALADDAAASEDILDDRANAPVVQLINALLSEAIREKASDIHIEPHETRLVIRFRIDGVLRDRIEPKRNLAPMLVSRIKVMAGLDIAEKRKPHDGRVTLNVGGHEVDVRVSTIPSQYGERVVLRLLDRTTAKFNLTQLGMTHRDHSVTERLLAKPGGMILVTGPTGSGKTTTLYSAITYLNDRSRNIMTVEDPIEYAFDGIGQMQVNPHKGVTFAEGVRVLMRQDPNVILIGEIRDPETASAAVRATTSGHLVLSTLHTTSAIASITRLVDMGVDRYLLATILSGLIAQRLVRRLCDTCKLADELTETEASRLVKGAEIGMPVFRAVGCPACAGHGYRGRTAIYEVVEVDGELEKLIHSGAAETELTALARLRGPSLSMDGAARIREGITTVEEVLSAADAGKAP